MGEHTALIQLVLTFTVPLKIHMKVLTIGHCNYLRHSRALINSVQHLTFWNSNVILCLSSMRITLRFILYSSNVFGLFLVLDVSMFDTAFFLNV